MDKKKQIEIPEFITKNYYKAWSEPDPSIRVQNQRKIYDEAKRFFISCGFKITLDYYPLIEGELSFEGCLIKFKFRYTENRKGKFKDFFIFKDEEKSNIRTLRKIVSKLNS